MSKKRIDIKNGIYKIRFSAGSSDRRQILKPIKKRKADFIGANFRVRTYKISLFGFLIGIFFDESTYKKPAFDFLQVYFFALIPIKRKKLPFYRQNFTYRIQKAEIL